MVSFSACVFRMTHNHAINALKQTANETSVIRSDYLATRYLSNRVRAGKQELAGDARLENVVTGCRT